MNNQNQDAGIPVLTEVIPPTAGAVPEIPPAPPAAKPVVIHNTTPPAPVAKSAATDDKQWQQLEHEVRERVLKQIMERIDLVLEQRVRDSLADVLQTAVTDLAAEIRTGLQYSLKEAVTHAVGQEISKLQETKK